MSYVSQPELEQLARKFSLQLEDRTDRLRLSFFFNWTSFSDLTQLFCFLFTLFMSGLIIYEFQNHFWVWVGLFFSGSLSLLFLWNLPTQCFDFLEITPISIKWRNSNWQVQQLPLHRHLKLHIVREDYEYQSRRAGTFYLRDLTIYLVDGTKRYPILDLNVDQKHKADLDRLIKPVSHKIKMRIENAGRRA